MAAPIQYLVHMHSHTDLSIASEERGTDATGIAYNHNGKQIIYKRPLPAHLMWYRVPVEAAVVMGHTRMATCGNPKIHIMNHPFPGCAGSTRFALAHNGVLLNDKTLRRDLELPATKIKTDSYIAVQLLETFGKVDFDGLRFMSEKLEGSFCITALADNDELYFVKGNNPIAIRHFPEAKLYVYASTEDILQKALMKAGLSLGTMDRVNMYTGELLRIDARGKITRSHFDDSHLYPSFSFSWPRWEGYETVKRPYAENTGYLDDLKAVASLYGLYPDKQRAGNNQDHYLLGINRRRRMLYCPSRR